MIGRNFCASQISAYSVQLDAFFKFARITIYEVERREKRTKKQMARRVTDHACAYVYVELFLHSDNCVEHN